MIKDSRGLTIESVGSVYGQGPVLYTSLPVSQGFSARQRPQERGINLADEKHYLVSSLREHLLAMGHSFRSRSPWCNSAGLPIQVVEGLFGRPQLLLGGRRGPAISFCKGGGNLFAAICADRSDIGIDGAEPHEFQGNYPVYRVFHQQELDHTLTLVNGRIDMASALLWSIKEAVVKALGCGFHLLDPRQMIVYPSTGGTSGKKVKHDFSVILSEKGAIRFPLAAGCCIRARSLFLKNLWLSVAVLNWQPRQCDRPWRS